MKKRLDLEDPHELEIFKAVAQAWHTHSAASKPATSEFDAHRRNFKNRPTRFKLEAMRMLASSSSGNGSWDFRHSLLDSYEIVAVAKRLEAGLDLENPFAGGVDDPSCLPKRRRKESKNSLRNLFNHMSSRRFNEPQI